MVMMVAISLSMDAFSLSLAYGTLNMQKKDINCLSIIVGIYHLIMPLIGMYVGKTIIGLLPIQPNTLVFIVLFFIGTEMIIESFKEDKNIKILSIIEMLLFGFAVSLDSFSVGLGLKVLYKTPFVAALIFMISSFIFTYLGLILGKKISSLVGKIATIFGGITLIIIGIIYLV
jgi:putative Mn2+ efflux pump MntP